MGDPLPPMLCEELPPAPFVPRSTPDSPAAPPLPVLVLPPAEPTSVPGSVPSVAGAPYTGAPYTGTDTPSVAVLVALAPPDPLLFEVELLAALVLLPDEVLLLSVLPPQATLLLARAPMANMAARLMRPAANRGRT